MNVHPLWIVWLVLGLTAVFLLREAFRKPAPTAVSYEAAVEAAKLMKDWGVWMTTVSTGVIAANGVLLSKSAAEAPRLPLWANLSVLFIGLSIVFAAWVIGSLPSIVVRLRRWAAEPASPAADSSATAPTDTDKRFVTEDNDFYEARLFSFIPVRVGVVAALQHVFFVLGIYCFALYVMGVQCTY